MYSECGMLNFAKKHLRLYNCSNKVTYNNSISGIIHFTIQKAMALHKALMLGLL